MTILYVLVPLGVALTVGAVWAFCWAVDRRQFEDLEMAAQMPLDGDERD